MVSKTFQHPLMLGLLVGLYPGLFYISNNWFMFKPSLSLFIVGALSVTSFIFLGVYYLVLKKIVPLVLTRNASHTINRLFAAVAFLVWAYLLRQTLHSDPLNFIYVFLGQIKMFNVQIFLHVLFVGCASEWQHPNLLSKTKDHL